MSELVEAERTFASDLARTYSGSLTSVANPEPAPGASFTFGSEAQSKIAALIMRDPTFNERTEGLLIPEYFENAAEGVLVRLTQDYFKTYRRVPDTITLAKLIQDGLTNRIFRKDMISEIKNSVLFVVTRGKS